MSGVVSPSFFHCNDFPLLLFAAILLLILAGHFHVVPCRQMLFLIELVNNLTYVFRILAGSHGLVGCRQI